MAVRAYLSLPPSLASRVGDTPQCQLARDKCPARCALRQVERERGDGREGGIYMPACVCGSLHIAD